MPSSCCRLFYRKAFGKFNLTVIFSFHNLTHSLRNCFQHTQVSYIISILHMPTDTTASLSHEWSPITRTHLPYKTGYSTVAVGNILSFCLMHKVASSQWCIDLPEWINQLECHGGVMRSDWVHFSMIYASLNSLTDIYYPTVFSNTTHNYFARLCTIIELLFSYWASLWPILPPLSEWIISYGDYFKLLYLAFF